MSTHKWPNDDRINDATEKKGGANEETESKTLTDLVEFIHDPLGIKPE